MLVVESDQAMAKVIERALAPRTVIVAASIEQALRCLDRTRRVAVLVSNYRLRDGTARKLFVGAARRFAEVRRILCADAAALASPYARHAVALAHAVVGDFEALRCAVDAPEAERR